MRMIRCIMSLVVMVLMILAASGAPPEGELLPYQKVLQGDDAKQAEQLATDASNLEATGKFQEAADVAKKMLDIRRRGLGTEHYLTAAAERWIKTLEIQAKMSPEDQAKFQTIRQLVKDGKELERQNRFADAQAKCEQFLKMRQELLGLGHYDVGFAHRDLAYLFRSQGKYAEARTHDQKSIEIHVAQFGEDNPNTAIAYSNYGITLNYLREYIEADKNYQKSLQISLRVSGEKAAQTATCYNNLGHNWVARGNLAEAITHYRKAVEIAKSLPKPDETDIVLYESNVATALHQQTNYAEADPYFRRALEYYLSKPDKQLDAARTYINLARNQEAMGKLTEAQPLHEEGLKIWRQILTDDHHFTAIGFNNLALNRNAQGKYGEAGLLYQKSVTAFRRVMGDNDLQTALAFNNYAQNLSSQRRYAEAQPLLERALAIHSRNTAADPLARAILTGNLARNLSDQGRYEEAAELYAKALEVLELDANKGRDETAICYGNRAYDLQMQGKPAEAETLLRKALAIRLAVFGENHPRTALSYRTLGAVLSDQGKNDEAAELHLKALAATERLLGPIHPDTAAARHALAATRYRQGQLDEAEALWIKAVESFEAARLFAALTGLERTDFAADRPPYLFLTALLAKRGKSADAWARLEAGLARGLLDELASPLSPEERKRRLELRWKRRQLDDQIVKLESGKTPTQADQLRQQRDRVQSEWADFEAELVSKYAPAAGQVYDLARLQAALPPHAAFVAWIDVTTSAPNTPHQGEHWACLVRSRGEPVWVTLPGSGPDQTWTAADADLSGKVRQLLARAPVAGDDAWREPTKLLAQQRLSPLKPHLGATGDLPAVTHLIALPSPALAGIPLDAMKEVWNLPSTLSISYSPSATIFAWLREKPPCSSQKLLALGDPIFRKKTVSPDAVTPPDHGVFIVRVVPRSNGERAGLKDRDILLTYGDARVSGPNDLRTAMANHKGDGPRTVRVWRAGQEVESKIEPGPLGVIPNAQPAALAFKEALVADAVVRGRWGEVFAPLPGSRREVEAIARLFPTAERMLGADASEKNLDDLARDEGLKSFGYVHLATHGRPDTLRPLSSALILTEDGLPDPAEQLLAGKEVYTGWLTAERVLHTWKLDADLVTLSSCESGLGKYSGGEGYVGFAQALFLSGGRSLVLSQWKVPDEATALLMVRFYQNLLGQHGEGSPPMPKALALAEAQQWLRMLTLAKAMRLRQDWLSESVAELSEEADRIRPYEHPHFWSGFILVGDPGDTTQSLVIPCDTGKNQWWPWLGVGLVTVVVAGGVFVLWRRTRTLRG